MNSLNKIPYYLQNNLLKYFHQIASGTGDHHKLSYIPNIYTSHTATINLIKKVIFN